MILTGLCHARVRRRSTWGRSSSARTTTSARAGVRDLYRLVVEVFSNRSTSPSTSSAWSSSACTSSRRLERLAVARRRSRRATTPVIRRIGWSLGARHRPRLRPRSRCCVYLSGAAHDARREGPRRPARRQVGAAQVRDRSWSTRPTGASTPSSSWAPASPARRPRPRSASSATTSSASASTTARAARTASPRRAASTPRRTTRTTATASTGSSTTRSRAATTARARPTSTGWRSCRVEHHRPVRRAGRAVRARVRRPARQPLVRRRAGVAHLLRARPDRPAAAARRLPVDDAPGRTRARVKLFPRREMLDLVVVDGQARGIICATSSPGAHRALRRRRGRASPPAATAPPTSSRPTR